MKISDDELAVFLRQLASLYKSPVVGNPALSAGLRELALYVSKRQGEKERVFKNSSPEKRAVETYVDLNFLRKLSIKEVEIFIADEEKTKQELIELASARFSMPRSKLLKLRAPEVRSAIRSVLLYEDSIDIISSEAKRDAAMRRS